MRKILLGLLISLPIMAIAEESLDKEIDSTLNKAMSSVKYVNLGNETGRTLLRDYIDETLDNTIPSDVKYGYIVGINNSGTDTQIKVMYYIDDGRSNNTRLDK